MFLNLITDCSNCGKPSVKFKPQGKHPGQNVAYRPFILKSSNHTIRQLISSYVNWKCLKPSKENDKQKENQNLIEYSDKYTIIL